MTANNKNPKLYPIDDIDINQLKSLNSHYEYNHKFTPSLNCSILTAPSTNANTVYTCTSIRLSDLKYTPKFDDLSKESNKSLSKGKNTLSVNEIKERTQKLYKIMEKKYEKDQLKKKVDKSLEKTGFMLPQNDFNNSKLKVKAISALRSSFTGKEFSSVKQPPDNSKFSPRTERELDCYSVMKKRRLSKSVQKQYASELILDDLYDENEKIYFKLYCDDDIGISKIIQEEMEENRADEDVESCNELISNAMIKIRKDIEETKQLIKQSGIEYNLRNKCKIKLN